MRKAIPILAAMLSGLVLTSAAFAQRSTTSSGKPTYKWVDEKGVTHYGDSVPAEYSQREKRVLNTHGVEMNKQMAEMTPAESAAYAEKVRQETRRKQHDFFLISTYPSVREIENVRDTRLGQIGAQVSAAEAYIATLSTRV